MGLARKLRKRADRFARVGKAKAEKRERKATEKMVFTAKKRERDIWDMEQQTWNDTQVVIYTALHQENGFGGKRLTRLFQRVRNLAYCVRDDDVTEQQLVDMLKEDTHYDATLPDMNPHDDHSVKLRSVYRMLLYFFWALHGEFGFGKKQFLALRKACAKIGQELTAGTRSLGDMVHDLEHLRDFNFEREA